MYFFNVAFLRKIYNGNLSYLKMKFVKFRFFLIKFEIFYNRFYYGNYAVALEKVCFCRINGVKCIFILEFYFKNKYTKPITCK